MNDRPPSESAQPGPDEALAVGIRKIIHVDMDAFYASVEQRDDPSLRGRPVAVGGSSGRGVVAAASYEARKFGVRSAMPSATAARLCPALTFRKPRFEVYKQVSDQIRAIFHGFTPHVEPLSLDEAYLDVTEDIRGIGSATRIAELIRGQVRNQTGLTASAGVSYNKFLAKLASDQNKPDGLCVIRPGEGARFVAGLPVARFHGVGPRGAEKLAALGIHTGADLARHELSFLRQHLGSFADYLYRAARGIDLRPVQASRRRKSVSAERTFSQDISAGAALRDTIEEIIGIAWERIARAQASGRTVTLKLKYSDFTQATRARTFATPIADREAFAAAGRALLEEALPLPQPIRLMGLGLSGLSGAEDKDSAEKPSRLAPDEAQLALF